MKKERVLIRFRPEIYECFELEAAYQGLRVGTIANQLLISELNKAASVKPEHCVVFGSEDYAAIPEGKRSSYYVLPESKDIIEYLPEQTGKRGAKPINKQVTFYLMEDQLENVEKNCPDSGYSQINGPWANCNLSLCRVGAAAEQ